MQLLQHPNVVRLIDTIDIPSKDQICLVMEYMEGGDLYECLEASPMDEKKAANIFYQLLCAVNHCHERQVVHRDLKPENILLNKARTTAKITDFGLANLIESGAFLVSRCGSPLYASPEILVGKKYGPEVDAWSLGVILYAMVSGCLPWSGETLEQQVTNAILGKYVPLESVSEGCQDVIACLLNTDPQCRATIPQLLEHPWVKKGTQTQHSELNSVNKQLHELKVSETQEIKPSSLDP